MRIKENERLAVVEEKIPELKKDISEVKGDVRQIKDFITASNLTSEVANLKYQIMAMQKSNNFWKFLSPTLAAITGSVLTFLIIEYLKKQ